jgi:hypothetical protein
MIAKEEKDDNSIALSDDDSVDTNEAFMEMLGFSTVSINSLNVVEEPAEVCTDIISVAPSSTFSNILLPTKCSRQHLPPSSCFAVVIDDVLTALECQDLINRTKSGFRYITEATHKSPDGTTYSVEIQNPNPHKLAAIDTSHGTHLHSDSKKDQTTLMMDKLYSTILSSLKSNSSFHSFVCRTKCGEAQALNPRMRILRYDSQDNDLFDPHFDATTRVPDSLDSSVMLKSLITVLVYLNDGDGEEFDGGETLYHDYHNSKTGITFETRDGSEVKVVPKVGRVCCFEHDLYHSGAPLEWGTKFVMRTDILFEDTSESSDIIFEECIVNEQSMLLSALCEKINISQKVSSILKEMEILHTTCESFLSPGVTLLKGMLIDAGIDKDIASSLIEEAVKVTNA